MDGTFEQLITSRKLTIFYMAQPESIQHPEKPEKPRERRVSDKGLGGRVLSIEERLVDGTERMNRMESKLDENSAITGQILDIVTTAKSFFKVLGWIGSCVKWATAVLASLAALYAAWTAFVGQIGHK